jgi:hypothetical protein
VNIRDIYDTAKMRLGLADPLREVKHLSHQQIRLTNPWHAVAIQPGPKRCKPVEQLAGRRFLSKEAPKTPLRECTEAQCTCRYRHYEDRRVEGASFDRNGRPLPHPRRRNTD